MQCPVYVCVRASAIQYAAFLFARFDTHAHSHTWGKGVLMYLYPSNAESKRWYTASQSWKLAKVILTCIYSNLPSKSIWIQTRNYILGQRSSANLCRESHPIGNGTEWNTTPFPLLARNLSAHRWWKTGISENG